MRAPRLRIGLGHRPRPVRSKGAQLGVLVPRRWAHRGKRAASACQLQDSQQALERIGLQLNLSKCRLWGPGFQVDEQGAPLLPPEFALNHPSRGVPIIPFGGVNGITAIGVPVDAPKGHRADPLVAPECNDKWQKAVAQAGLLLERLRLYPESQVRLTLLRYCLDACRVVHFLRSSEVEEAGQHPAHLRAKLQDAVQDLLALGLTEATWEQVCLTTRLGGLGISDPAVVQPAARLAGLLNLEKNGTDATKHSNRAEAQKVQADGPSCEAKGWGFFPFALSTWGGMGSSAKAAHTHTDTHTHTHTASPRTKG